MSFSSGTFSLFTPGNPVVTGTTIASTWANQTLTDVATGLSTCLLKDGTQGTTARIPFAQGINISAGTVGAPALYMSTDTTTGFYRASANQINVTVSGTQVGFFNSSGINAISNVITPTVDSGGTGSLSLKTNNGTTGLTVGNVASAVNFFTIQPQVTGTFPQFSTVNSSDPNVGLSFFSKGTGSFDFYSRADVAIKQQFSVIDTASSTRWITVTGSNGGNPTINTTGGSLAITPAVLMSSTLGAVGAITALNGTAISAALSQAFAFSTTTAFGIYFGSGAPTQSAAKGSLYLRSDGTTTNDRAYINTNGSTTWTAITTVA